MTIRTIPVSYVFTCDFCKTESAQDSNNIPKYWGYLRIVRDAYDWSGCAVGNASTESLLCTECREAIEKAVEQVRLSKNAEAQ